MNRLNDQKMRTLRIYAAQDFINGYVKWTELEEENLKRYAANGDDTIDIAYKLGRSVKAVQEKASELGISLKPND